VNVHRHALELIVITAVDGNKYILHSLVSLKTLAKLFWRGERRISHADAHRVVTDQLEKFKKVIAARYRDGPSTIDSNPRNPNELRYELTLNDLQTSGQIFSAAVLSSPPGKAWRASAARSKIPPSRAACATMTLMTY
jgi:hypothetical protein